MNRSFLSATVYLSAVIAALILVLAIFSSWTFPLLSLDQTQVSQGEFWRILTGNIVHFGWAHTLMNVAAFLLCVFGLLPHFSILRFSLLLFGCCIAVGAGMYWLNNEYTIYAGLSGAIHGLVIVGLARTQLHPVWVRILGLALVAGKLIQEQSASYETTDLQALIPVPVAVDAHLYGALAGVVFLTGDYLIHYFRRKH